MISHTEQMGTCYEHTGEHESSFKVSKTDEMARL